jgi:hypothetical protein
MAMLGISSVQLFECLTTTELFLSKSKVTDLNRFFQSKRKKSKGTSLVMWNFLDAPRKLFRTVELTKGSTTNLQLQASRNASIARIFGKLAEDRVLIDVSQGKCCFSGCPGCDFYNDDGTYQYEEFRAYVEGSLTDSNKVPQSPEPLSVKSKAAPAAWIPVYSYRSVGGTERHVAKWTRVLFPTDQDKSLCKDLFCQRLLDYTDGTPISYPVIECEDVILTYPPKSGCVKVSDITLLKDPYFLFGNPAIHNSTKMIKKVENNKYDTEVIEALWRLMAVHGSSLTKRQIANRLKKWNEGMNNSLEGIGFSSFAIKLW